MEYKSLEGYVVQVRKANEKLETEKVLHCDEIRALKSEVRSYQDELARTRAFYEAELAGLREEIEYREERRQVRRNEIRALKVEANSQIEVIRRLEAERHRQEEEIRALEDKARSHQVELGQARKEIGKLEADRVLQQEEIRALKVEDLQKTPARNIGIEVRLRYLEHHRRRMGRRKCATYDERIKCGDRAAHRGRPVVDALLCLTGTMKDPKVYPDLYGVSPELMNQWKDVREIVDVTGFRASLQSERRLTAEFQTPFETLLKIAKKYRSPTELIAAFGENKVLQQLHGQLQLCYDGIVQANPRCKNRDSALLGSDFSV